MSTDVDWDINQYREEHESDEHWELRRKFMVRWKDDFEQDRLVCLARVFANIELLGCRYPPQVMQEVAKLAQDVAKDYRNARKDKLKRTFVSASDAAEDRAKGVKREGGIIMDGSSNKSATFRIQFVKSGHVDANQENDAAGKSLPYVDANRIGFRMSPSPTRDVCSKEDEDKINEDIERVAEEKLQIKNYYMNEFNKLQCVNLTTFRDDMFNTEFGRFVLIVKPWVDRWNNISASCQASKLPVQASYVNGTYTFEINGTILAKADGTKAEARNIAETLAWNRLQSESISILVKEQFIAQNDTEIIKQDFTKNSRRQCEFGAPVETTVATKMMKMMGWKGGGLGADAQGIAEPVKPNFQMVNRAGLGSESSDLRDLRFKAQRLMQRFKASDSIDVDLVFSPEFNKEERAMLHQMAMRSGLKSQSYGKDQDRFLVVKTKVDWFSLTRTVIEKGGNTPKYEVYIPISCSKRSRR